MRRLIVLRRALVLGLLLVGLMSSLPAVQAASPGVLITEVQAANTRTVADDQGGYSDWIELHNPTDTPVSLLGYTLTDDPDEPAKWSLPAAGTGGLSGWPRWPRGPFCWSGLPA